MGFSLVDTRIIMIRLWVSTDRAQAWRVEGPQLGIRRRRGSNIAPHLSFTWYPPLGCHTGETNRRHFLF